MTSNPTVGAKGWMAAATITNQLLMCLPAEAGHFGHIWTKRAELLDGGGGGQKGRRMGRRMWGYPREGAAMVVCPLVGQNLEMIIDSCSQ